MSISHKKMVSIIIPAYNVEKYIERCVESSIKQTLKNIEIIIINDGSFDNTETIIQELALRDNRIKIIKQKNKGLASARNVGILMAEGEYIQHLDGDDWLEINACEKLYEISKQKNLDLLICDFYKDFDNGKKIKIKSFNFEDNVILTNKDCLEELGKNNINSNIWAKFIKRDLYIKNNILHLEKVSLGEDLVTIPKLIALSKKICKLNKAYYHYIYNPKSITNDSFSKKIGDLFLCFEDLEKYFFNEKDKYNYLNILKANHLANFFYNKPLNTKDYLINFYRFTNYIDNLEEETLKKINKKKAILYYFFKILKNEKFRLTFIKYFSFIRKIKKRN